MLLPLCLPECMFFSLVSVLLCCTELAAGALWEDRSLPSHSYGLQLAFHCRLFVDYYLLESICPCCCRHLQAFGHGPVYEYLLLLNYDGLIRYVLHFHLPSPPLRWFFSLYDWSLRACYWLFFFYCSLLPFCPSWWIKKINRMHFKDDNSTNKVRNCFPAKCTDWESYWK